MIFDQQIDELSSLLKLFADITANSDIESYDFDLFWRFVTKTHKINTRAVWRSVIILLF
jgi:hypothetical protein